MKCMCKCITAATHLSPKKDDTITVYRFVPLDSPTRVPGKFWSESAVEVYDEKEGKFKVGKDYELNLEVTP